MTNNHPFDDFDEVLAELDSEDGDCSHPEIEDFVQETFLYPGSALEPFEVINAPLRRCKNCSATFYQARDAKDWDVAKARELIARGGPYYGREVTFLWQCTGLSLNQFADEMHVGTDVATSRRIIQAWEISQIPRNLESLFIERIERWLEREEVWQNHLKQKYSNKAGN